MSAIDYIERRNVAYYRTSLPVNPARPDRSHTGTWCAVLTTEVTSKDLEELFDGKNRDEFAEFIKRQVLPYDLVVHTYSNLVFNASATQSDYEPGAVAALTATLREYDVPVDGRAKVWADLTRPDRTTAAVVLDEVEPGRFEGAFGTDVAGVYTARIRADGETFHGSRFTREQTLTVAVRPGGNRPAEPHASDAWCDLLECLGEAGVFRSETADRLRKQGIDIDAIVKCFKSRCSPDRKPS